jgi:transcriptional regulator with XRE-family HTH domain
MGGLNFMKQHQQSDHHKKIPSTLADLLKCEREAAGLNRTEMADTLGISRPYLTRLESGESKHASPVVLGHIAERLNVSIEDLYALTGYIPSTELPNFGPYLRALHPDWPDSAITLLDDFHDFLRYKHSLR